MLSLYDSNITDIIYCVIVMYGVYFFTLVFCTWFFSFLFRLFHIDKVPGPNTQNENIDFNLANVVSYINFYLTISYACILSLLDNMWALWESVM